MESFIAKSASYIFKKYNLETLKKICVVLPSRRAAYFFKKELSELSDTPFISPNVYSIDDFVTHLSGYKLLDNISLLFELYEVFKVFDNELVFEKFIKWAPTVLKDFDTIDQSMVANPHDLFNYISEAEALKRWDLSEEQDFEFSETVINYFDFFAQLSKVYAAFYQNLSLKGNAYRGMAYKIVANEIDNLILENKEFEFFHFVGLNALSKSEEIIVTNLVKANKAECLWDSDSYYMNNLHKAGTVLNSYKINKTFGEWNWEVDFLTTTSKNISIYNHENNLSQTKLIGDLISKDDDLLKSTVIVILDEGLISPLLFSLPDSIKDFNITMGLPLKGSMIASLIDNLFELQETKFKKAHSNQYSFNYKSVLKLISNPIIKIIEDGLSEKDRKINKLKNYILNQNRAYIDLSDIKKNDLNNRLFEICLVDWDSDYKKCIKQLHEFTEYLQLAFQNGLNTYEIEFFYLLTSIINRLSSIVNSNDQISISGIRLLLNELFKEERVPFTGEPVAELQIMSMLETRCLDFDNVLIMSMNEGTLPNSQKNKSLIPFDACRIFDLPIYSDQDNVMFYHFYRLLQRAKNVHLSYLSSSGSGIGVKEKSRFILQIENELLKANSNLNLNWPTLQYNSKINLESSDIEIIKDTDLIKTFLTEKGLSPSSINQYLRCPLQFYWSKIEKIGSLDEIEENFKVNVFGTLVHRLLENIDKPYLSLENSYNAQAINSVISNLDKELNNILSSEFENFEVNSGLNAILVQIAKRLVSDFLNYQIQVFELPIQIAAVEKEFNVSFEFKSSLNESLNIIIKGKVDRIEIHKDFVRIVDYKTGKVESKSLTSKEPIEDVYLNPDFDKFRQLKLYQYFILKNNKDSSFNSQYLIHNNLLLNANIYSLRNLSDALLVNPINPDVSSHEALIFEVETFLGKIIKELLDQRIPIKQTNDLKICEQCDFKKICGKL